MLKPKSSGRVLTTTDCLKALEEKQQQKAEKARKREENTKKREERARAKLAREIESKFDSSPGKESS